MGFIKFIKKVHKTLDEGNKKLEKRRQENFIKETGRTKQKIKNLGLKTELVKAQIKHQKQKDFLTEKRKSLFDKQFGNKSHDDLMMKKKKNLDQFFRFD